VKARDGSGLCGRRKLKPRAADAITSAVAAAAAAHMRTLQYDSFLLLVFL